MGAGNGRREFEDGDTTLFNGGQAVQAARQAHGVGLGHGILASLRRDAAGQSTATISRLRSVIGTGSGRGTPLVGRDWRKSAGSTVLAFHSLGPNRGP